MLLSVEDFSQDIIDGCVKTFDLNPNLLDNKQQQVFLMIAKNFPKHDDTDLFLDLISGLNNVLAGSAVDILLSAQKTFSFIQEKENRFETENDALHALVSKGGMSDERKITIPPRSENRGSWRVAIVSEVEE